MHTHAAIASQIEAKPAANTDGVASEAGGAVEIGFVGPGAGCEDADAVREKNRGVGGGGRGGHRGGYGEVR